VIVIEIEIAIVIVVKRAKTAASDWADKHKAQEQQQKGRTDRVRERGCSMYSGGKRHAQAEGYLSTQHASERRWGSTTHTALVAAMRRTAGSSFAEHPCATKDDIRLASGVAGKLTVAASRPSWITMVRLVWFGSTEESNAVAV
jgi:hypothetical protein